MLASTRLQHSYFTYTVFLVIMLHWIGHNIYSYIANCLRWKSFAVVELAEKHSQLSDYMVNKEIF